MFQWIVSLFHFRNDSHFIWFFGSMVCLALALAYLIWRRKKTNGIFLWFPAVMHLQTSVTAAVEVLWLKKASEAFSADCVWFNALMFGAYAFIFFAFRKTAKINSERSGS